MKKRLTALLAAVGLALLALLAGGAAPAQAAATVALPADLAGHKFWSPSVCVDGSAIDGPYYRVAYLAQQVNLRTSQLSLDYSDDCAADGYPPSRIMVIQGHTNPADTTCLQDTNTGSGYYNVVNGMKRWTYYPAQSVNFASTTCISSQARRDHVVSAAIVNLLGAKFLNSAGYNSRVMNWTNWSFDNVPTIDQNTANALDALYAYAYCQPFGTTC